MRRTPAILACLWLGVSLTGCHSAQCEKGRKLRDNLGHLEYSLRSGLSAPDYLRELCAWVKEKESPYLRLSALELAGFADAPASTPCASGAGSAACKSEASARGSARELSTALIGQFGIVQNIESMCAAYVANGFTVNTQLYIRDTINQLRNPVSQGAAHQLLAYGSCGE
jgi:hypothetical protein